MTKLYHLRAGKLLETESAEDSIWVDLHSPSREDEIGMEKLLGIELPTREDMEEIEISSRLYEEAGGVFMTVQLPSATEDDATQMGPVTFVLVEGKLITIRYHDPRTFTTFPVSAARTAIAGKDRL